MARFAWVALALSGLAACAAPMPESGPTYFDQSPDAGRGTAFGSYDPYAAGRSARDVELEGDTQVLPSRPGEPVITSAELAAAGLPAGGIVGGSAQNPVVPSMAPGRREASIVVDTDNPGISDEQDFQAVSGRVSIEDDKERIAAQREAYRVIQPTALPRRSGGEGPNIVDYALRSTNKVGESLYSRSGFNAQSKFLRGCASYASSDLAQQAFLAEGGPEKDRLGLDPDGDGFACYWDPAPFRKVRG
ncbi:hypothetical protein [Profundibacterium mesophilum]|uniref:Prokaryotic membrane lipoprotein lipid attachment site domain containing protein n=1 Tax=Profundibacterium mesophilum KAUST100406-0324 TaxID=1037889 RepID=A0A921TC87_9RHOB|nr:hypothetical protein [Profundibacterium mesophilum]KAF0675388.1 Prokaryotic membrane lipoprotein lipid attachment site domain containing protein [Profundibacterium mesophilum KAUST100406-0324]